MTHLISTLGTPVDTDLCIGFDVGSTKADVLVFDFLTRIVVFSHRYPTADFHSFDALLDQVVGDLGVVPGRIMAAIAGPRKGNGDIQITNQKSWPLFEVSKTAVRLGAKIRTVNDMVATAAGLDALVISEQGVMKSGTAEANGPQLVIAVSTGIGDAQCLPDGTPVASEGGHSTWQPMTELEDKYLRYLRDKYGADTITVELAASGSYGFPNIYDFLLSQGRKPGRRFATELHCEHRGAGEIITRAALEGDPFCWRAMNLMGSILGQHVRNRAVGTLPTGGIYFVGSVMQASGVAAYIVQNTPFLLRFIAEGAEHSKMMAGIPIYVVNDRAIAVKGALELAKRM